MIREPVARRYARALFDAAWAAGEAGTEATTRRDAALRYAIEVGKNLEAIDRFLDDPAHAEWRDLLLAPQIAREERSRIIDRLFADRAHPLVLRFFHLLHEKRRLEVVADVWEAYRVLLDEVQGVVRAEVTTAIPLPADLREALRRGLLERLRREGPLKVGGADVPVADVVLDLRIDESLLGGVRVRIGDRVIEQSVRRSLEELTGTLLSAPILG
jgi:F-type H+-transporting ATPase subunit delta